MFRELAINCSNFKGMADCAGRRISIRKGGEAMGPLAGSVVTCAYDANGNITEYVSGSGEILSHNDYSAFGRELIKTGSDDITHRFSTKPLCRRTGLLEYQLRKYKPWCGRWINRDPIEERPIFYNNKYSKLLMQSFSLKNPYLYCKNSETESVDVLGLSECSEKDCNPCDDEYKWRGAISVISLSHYVGTSLMVIDLKSNIVCGDCMEHHLTSTVLLGTLSIGVPFSITGSNVEFGNYHPDDFSGTVYYVSAGVGAMGVVESSAIRIGKAVAVTPIGISGGGSMGISGSIGKSIDFNIRSTPYGK